MHFSYFLAIFSPNTCSQTTFSRTPQVPGALKAKDYFICRCPPNLLLKRTEIWICNFVKRFITVLGSWGAQKNIHHTFYLSAIKPIRTEKESRICIWNFVTRFMRALGNRGTHKYMQYSKDLYYIVIKPIGTFIWRRAQIFLWIRRHNFFALGGLI